METHASNWEFDPSLLLIRNKATGQTVPLRTLDTPEALLQETLRLAREDRPLEDARGFTNALRHACSVVFQSSLKDVYCCADRPLRHVDWRRRASRNNS